MASEQWVGWLIYSIVGILVIGFSAWFIGHYKLRDEPSGVTGAIGFFSILFALLSLFLIPVDVYMCSEYDNAHYRSAAKYTYYTFYSIFLFCLFVAIPFGYFYYEELGDIEDRTNTFSKRACSALKYTVITALLWLVLIVVGLFVDFNSRTSDTGDDAWTHVIADTFSSHVDGIMPFCIAVVTAFGMFFSMMYTAVGLAAFPISLLRPMVAPQQQVQSANAEIELQRVKADLDMLYTKYRGRENNWSALDKAKKNMLERKKQQLTDKKQRTSSLASSAPKYRKETCCEKFGRCFWNTAAPIRYAIGIALEGISLLLIVSMTMHVLDQAINSSCGYQCGFALNDPKFAKYDPVSWIMTNCAPYFPLDYIVFSSLIFWIFWCTIYGIITIDVRFLCFKLFSLRAHGTMHNGLLMVIAFLLLILTSFNYLVYTLAAQYMTFGDQGTNCAIVCDSSIKDCQVCQGTEIYYLLSGIIIGMPIFGLIYFVLTALFIVVFLISLAYNLYKKPQRNDDRLLVPDDDDIEAIFKD